MYSFNVTIDELREQNCSEQELNITSGTLKSFDGENCTVPSERVHTINLLAERRYDLAVICCGIVVVSVCFNGVLVNGLTRRGGRLVVGVARSFLLLNLVAADCLVASGGCGMLLVALVGGRWPFGDVGCSAYSLSTIAGQVVSNYTLAGFIIERCVITRRKFIDSWKLHRDSVTSVALATIARSRDRETRRFVVTAVTISWITGLILGLLPVCTGLFSFVGDADSFICAVLFHRRAVAVSFVTSLVVGCLLPVTVGGAAYRKFMLMKKAVESTSDRCSRKQSSLVWLATRISRRSSRFSVVSAERRSVSSACEVVLRDVDITSKRSHDDEVSQTLLTHISS